MTIEEENKYLEKLAKSTEGEALKQRFERLITKLTDSRNYKSDDFEIEGKSSVKAAAVLKKIMTDLNLLKKTKKEREHNPYV